MSKGSENKDYSIMFISLTILIVLSFRKSSTARDVPHLVPTSLVPQVDPYSPMGSHLLGSLRCEIMICHFYMRQVDGRLQYDYLSGGGGVP